MIIANQSELNTLRQGGKILAGILKKVVENAQVGVSTKELDGLCEGLIFSSGGEPVFKGYKIKGVKNPYPASLCVSVNDEIVHGIPSAQKILREGDVVSFDVGMRWPAFAKATAGKPAFAKATAGKPALIKATAGKHSLITDMALTIGIGKISGEAEKLIRTVKEALEIGIAVLKPGLRLGSLGFVIQNHLEKNGLGVIRDLAGHGVGKSVHEEPLVPNFGEKNTGLTLKEGMVIAIEPMATLGDWHIKVDDDQWTIRTVDKSLAAHFEHTVVITKNRAEILTQN